MGLYHSSSRKGANDPSSPLKYDEGASNRNSWLPASARLQKPVSTHKKENSRTTAINEHSKAARRRSMPENVKAGMIGPAAIIGFGLFYTALGVPLYANLITFATGLGALSFWASRWYLYQRLSAAGKSLYIYSFRALQIALTLFVAGLLYSLPSLVHFPSGGSDIELIIAMSQIVLAIPALGFGLAEFAHHFLYKLAGGTNDLEQARKKKQWGLPLGGGIGIQLQKMRRKLKREKLISWLPLNPQEDLRVYYAV